VSAEGDGHCHYGITDPERCCGVGPDLVHDPGRIHPGHMRRWNILEHLRAAAVPYSRIGRIDRGGVYANPNFTWAGMDIGQFDDV
jgi:hypothetical protein